MELNERIATSGIIEQRIRDGNYPDLSTLIMDYDEYMSLRYRMLVPKNMPRHEGSKGTYECTLELIRHTMDLAVKFNGPEKILFLRSLESDKKQITRLKEEFGFYLKGPKVTHYAETYYF